MRGAKPGISRITTVPLVDQSISASYPSRHDFQRVSFPAMAPTLGDLAIHIQSGSCRSPPRELTGPPDSLLAQAILPRPYGLDNGASYGRRILGVGQDRGSA